MPRSKARVLRVIKKRTGTFKSIKLDNKRKALPPAKRRSASGKTYYETRRNRSDVRGKKL